MTALKGVGIHYLIELYECQSPHVNNQNKLQDTLLQALKDAGATVFGHAFHSFSPHGVTGIILMGESHVAIHTWPEHAYVAADIFSCSSRLDVSLIVSELENCLLPTRSEVKNIARGTQINREKLSPTGT